MGGVYARANIRSKITERLTRACHKRREIPAFFIWVDERKTLALRMVRVRETAVAVAAIAVADIAVAAPSQITEIRDFPGRLSTP